LVVGWKWPSQIRLGAGFVKIAMVASGRCPDAKKAIAPKFR